MSIFLCEGCQLNRDSDIDGIHNRIDGLYCNDCDCKITDIEKLTKQCYGNSLEIRDLDRRIKLLEVKNNGRN